MSSDGQIPGDPNLIHPTPLSQVGLVQEGSGRKDAITGAAGGCSGAPGGIHNRPPIPGAGEKAECPKFMSHGPCGGVRKGGYCEVFPEMMCPWVVMYFDLEKLGKTEWMTEV
jgi:hypothetical protein